MRLARLLLNDGRFPAGAHAHSGGVEQAVADGRVHDLATLATFLEGLLRTRGLGDAALAAATVARAPEPPWDALVAEADARTASPVQREVQRRLGRQLLRVAARLWPLPSGVPGDAPLPVAHGAVALGARLGGDDAACAAAYAVVTTAATAGVRLLGLDPVGVQHVLLDLGPELDAVVGGALAAAPGPLADLPGASALLVEVGAEIHARQEVRLFAS